MSNVINLPRPGNHLPQRASYQRLRAPLDERLAWLDLQSKQQEYFCNPTDANESELLDARAVWDYAFQTVQSPAR